MNNTQSQNEAILAYLQRGGKVTSLTALTMFGCLRLSGRAYDIKKSGVDLKDRWVETPSGKRVKEYYLELEPQLSLIPVVRQNGDKANY